MRFGACSLSGPRREKCILQRQERNVRREKTDLSWRPGGMGPDTVTHPCSQRLRNRVLWAPPTWS